MQISHRDDTFWQVLELGIWGMLFSPPTYHAVKFIISLPNSPWRYVIVGVGVGVSVYILLKISHKIASAIVTFIYLLTR